MAGGDDEGAAVVEIHRRSLVVGVQPEADQQIRQANPDPDRHDNDGEADSYQSLLLHG